MENKEKEFLETLLIKLNEFFHNEAMFPANHEYTVNGKLTIEEDSESLKLIYVNGEFKKDTRILVTKTENESNDYKTLTTSLIFDLMFRAGSIKHDIPLLHDLILHGENWKEFVINQKEKGRLMKPYQEWGE